MKNIIFYLSLLLTSSLFSQDSYLKVYRIPNKVDNGFKMKDRVLTTSERKEIADKLSVLGKTADTSSILQKDHKIKYNNLNTSNPKEKEAKELIDKRYPNPNELIIYSYKTKLGGNEITAIDTVTVREYLDTLTINVSKKASYDHTLKGYIKFEKDKIYINPFLQEKSNNKYVDLGVHYYELGNRQSIRLTYQEFNVSAMTIPIKYRFRNKSKSVQETTSTDASGFVVFSYGKGWSYFFHREKVGNKVNSYKISLGGTIGLSSVELTSNNTSADDNPIGEDLEFTRGVISGGFGIFLYANKFNIGFIYGFDQAIGTYTKRWNYQGLPWLGVGIGFDIFK